MYPHISKGSSKNISILLNLFLFFAISFNQSFALPEPANAMMGFEYDKYTSGGVYLSELERIAEKSNGVLEYHTDRKCFGDSHDLYWVTIGDTSKPAIFMVSTLHARNEWMGANIMMHFLEKLITPDDNQKVFNSALLESHCIVAIPMANPWAYFESPDGMHYNNNPAPVRDIDKFTLHDTELYDEYYGVNLNRNFDWNWNDYGLLPWSVSDYWNGKDYGRANYFMMPFALNDNGEKVYDPDNQFSNRVLGPDPLIYDYKGESPFSEPETQLIRDLMNRYEIVGFSDWHQMNPWQKNNVSYISETDLEKNWIRSRIDSSIQRINERHPNTEPMPKCKHLDAGKYDNNGPYAVNWAAHGFKTRAFGWETGLDMPMVKVTDSYMQMMYLSVYWMAKEPFQ